MNFEVVNSYTESCEDEFPLSQFVPTFNLDVIIIEGFEERSVGLLKRIIEKGIEVRNVLIGEYRSKNFPENKSHRDTVSKLTKLSGIKESRIGIDDNGNWIKSFVKSSKRPVVLDITALSNRYLPQTLSALEELDNKIWIGYSTAKSYWPLEDEWNKMLDAFTNRNDLAEVLEQKPWLFGPEHIVQYTKGFEGYSSGANRCLISFLPFKSSRLSAIKNDLEFRYYYYIAGKPPCEDMRWRKEASEIINSKAINNFKTYTISTFGYRNTIRELSNILFRENVYYKGDVTFTLLGSKLNNFGIWALASHLPSVGLVTSTPVTYHPEAFSKGYSESYLFEFKSPRMHLKSKFEDFKKSGTL